MSQNTAAGVSYLTGIAGLIIFLMEKQNRFVRFHAMQSLLYSAVFFVLWIIQAIISSALVAGGSYSLAFVFGGLFDLIWLAGFVFWIIMIVHAFQGKIFKLPVIGDYAERFANQGLSS